MEDLLSMEDNMKEMRGCIEIARQRASDGEVVEYTKKYNTITTRGRRWVLDSMISGQSATTQVLNNIAVGTGTSSAPSTADTSLQSENTRKTVGTWDTSGLTAATPWFAAQVQFATDEANTTLGELGLFNSNANGTMLGRAIFTTINKSNTNTLGITYTISN